MPCVRKQPCESDLEKNQSGLIDINLNQSGLVFGYLSFRIGFYFSIPKEVED